MVDALIRDLVGPLGAEDYEVITDAPITRYSSGILFPQSIEMVDGSEDQDAPDDYDESAVPDPAISMANVRYPSSFGMTFAVDAIATSTLRIELTAARYVPLATVDSEWVTDQGGQATQADERWERVPVVIEPVTIEVGIPVTAMRKDVAPGLELFWRVRAAGRSNWVAVTLAMVNTNMAEGVRRDAVSFFQPSISVTASDPSLAVFVDRPAAGFFSNDEDLQSYRLLYRRARSFGVGHGCSVTWEANEQGDRARRVLSTFTPQHELLVADSNPAIDSPCLVLSHLTAAPRTQVLRELSEFLGGYASWLNAKRQEASDLDSSLQPIADAHIAAIETVRGRLYASLDLLETDDTVWQSFVLANSAMLHLRARSEWLRAGKPQGGPTEGDDHRWRPFQLAFILLCLRGLADPQSPDRDVADLLWFPTGGGKTEAYFGLIAFMAFYRRLKYPSDRGAGVAVLMRYTLRLLTIQQFERATRLICCCEALRRSRPELGAHEITIGLWVGAGGTPNTLLDARKALDRLRANEELELEEKNPVQLHSCPWCGVPLDARNYYIATDPQHLGISCRETGCLFSRGLPVYVVDEELYREQPTLVIATADKYASLPWNAEVGRLFNLTGASARRPELIIQDELHLISGPLGTLAGLYETAIDYLCTQDGARPKVVASTATIRRARQQSSALFDRAVQQFPPSGLEGGDSYFAVESTRDRRGARLYLGLIAPGMSQTSLLVRAYAALLQAGESIPARASVKDPYWTLVGYFNSLRVLGGARMQVQDDVGDRLELLADEGGDERRSIENRIELTSREPSGAIPAHLKRMAVSRPDPSTLDVILATNMISVGVDIDRLGLMVVAGQPQSTSEYVQATSRVGRRWPGLVVVLFNAARSRDRSHYESFISYHSALYRQIESTSVTPFSSRSRDRALHAVVVALARQSVPGFKANKSARRILTHRGDLDLVKRVIIERVNRVAPEERGVTEDDLNRILDEWVDRARECPDLVYTNPSRPEQALLRDAGREADDGALAFATPRSLRDVDQSSGLFLVEG
jgi:hypothetical protein